MIGPRELQDAATRIIESDAAGAATWMSTGTCFGICCRLLQAKREQPVSKREETGCSRCQQAWQGRRGARRTGRQREVPRPGGGESAPLSAPGNPGGQWRLSHPHPQKACVRRGRGDEQHMGRHAPRGPRDKRGFVGGIFPEVTQAGSVSSPTLLSLNRLWIQAPRQPAGSPARVRTHPRAEPAQALPGPAP